MKTDFFDYELPEALIAERPPAARDGARMMIVEASGSKHAHVRDFCELVEPGSLLVLNETRVRPARLECSRPLRAGTTMGGGRAELLFLGATQRGQWRALGKANRPLRVGDELVAPRLMLRVADKEADGTLVLDVEGALEEVLEEFGRMPIPPYMRRKADGDDVTRYQTVFARQLGSVAAPTAGLHLTEGALERMRRRGVEIGRLTLHVGVGTFRPVAVDDLDEHEMHAEWIEVGEGLAQGVADTRARGGRVVAVGTTSVRALESAADPERPGRVVPFVGPTRLLIQPGYRFSVVDALLTNFHMPRSTLLALVSAFVGRENVLSAYREAVAARYRFLSYGDAMWLPSRIP